MVGRRKAAFPIPKKRFAKGTWEIYWYLNRKQYTIYPGFNDPLDEPLAEAERLAVAVSLAKNEALPETYRYAPGAVKFLADKAASFGAGQGMANAKIMNPDTWLEDYKENITSQCSPGWAKNSLRFLEQLEQTASNRLAGITPALANEFLDNLKNEGLTTGTRNRALAACSRFFNWAVSTERIAGNPFAGIKQIRENKVWDIVFCSRPEQQRILDAATTIRLSDRLAIDIAFFAGCRRSEIFRLEWEDVNLESRKIQIRKSKTGEPRTIDIGARLLSSLLKARKAHGYVVPQIDGLGRHYQAERIIDALREFLCEPKKPGPDGKPTGALGKREFIMSEEERREIAAARKEAEEKGELRKLFPYDAPAKAGDGKPWMPGNLIGWNAFRHTFGSLLVQAGESLDQVSAWMGNTPEVCRRHYASFERKKGRSRHIDRL